MIVNLKNKKTEKIEMHSLVRIWFELVDNNTECLKFKNKWDKLQQVY